MFRAGVGGKTLKAGILGQWISTCGEGWWLLGVWLFKNGSTHGLVWYSCVLSQASLWVDGLCIDQSNNQERAEQSKKIDIIFSQATSVSLVWLGS